jgi:hypothetical protein
MRLITDDRLQKMSSPLWSRAIVANRQDSLSLEVGPLPTTRATLPLPKTGWHKIYSAARTRPSLGFAWGFLLSLRQCVTPRLRMRHCTHLHNLSPIACGSPIQSQPIGQVFLLRLALWPAPDRNWPVVKVVRDVSPGREARAEPGIPLLSDLAPIILLASHWPLFAAWPNNLSNVPGVRCRGIVGFDAAVAPGTSLACPLGAAGAVAREATPG